MTMDWTAKDICRRLDALRSDRNVVEQTWQAIEMFIRPYSGKFFRQNTSESTIEWRRRNIFDGTAVMAAQSLSSSLHGTLTNPAMRWFGMNFRDDELKDDHEATAWLEKAAEKVYYTLQDSNFNLEANETYRDITSFGTGFLVCEPKKDVTADDWEGIDFTGVPIKECFFDEGVHGQVTAFYRLMEWPASRIVDKFGLPEVPEIVQKAYERADATTFEIVFCVFPQTARADNGTQHQRPSHRPYGYTYVFKQDQSELGKRGGYYEMPVYAPRWLTSSESRWGHSPATVALADVLTLNQLVELVLKAAEKVIDPTILVEERSILSNLDLGAGKVNVVRDISRIRPFESATRMDVAQLRIEDLRNAINKYFFIDQLALKESPAMTATEVQVRYELMHRLLAGTMARMRNDFLNPLVERTFRLLLRGGQLGEMPASVKAAGGADIDTEYFGPLARAQKSDASAATERWIAQLGQMAEMQIAAGQTPTALLVPNFEEMARQAGSNLNVPASSMNTKDEVTQAAAKINEQNERAANAAARKDEASAAKDQAVAEQTAVGGTDGTQEQPPI
jgi:hypothetical protein